MPRSTAATKFYLLGHSSSAVSQTWQSENLKTACHRTTCESSRVDWRQSELLGAGLSCGDVKTTALISCTSTETAAESTRNDDW